MSDELNFIPVEPAQILADMKSMYETLSGKTLLDGQLESILIRTFAYRETELRTIANHAAKMNLLRFSTAPYLDAIGERVGVNRLPASAAVCTIKLTFTPGHGNFILPKGIRIQPISGVAVFATDEEVHVDTLSDEYLVTATCLTEGTIGNGIGINELVVILDPQPYLLSAQNIDITSGGSEQESDEELRERIRLAPSTFSTAGPDEAYKYWAKTANPQIGDVTVTSLNPGEVNVFVLMKDGTLPNTTILEQVEDVLNDKKRRPLTDTVIVDKPDHIDYQIEVELTAITGSIASEIEAQVQAALEQYAKERGARMGYDIVVSKIKALCSIPGVYDVDVIKPTQNIEIGVGEASICTGVTVSVTGYSDE